MTVSEIEYGSEQYRLACALRESVLRRPLGLTLSDQDLHGEAQQLHFALFADDGELIACVTAAPQSPGCARIRQTAVLPHYQGRGMASTMMRQVEAMLLSRGFKSLTLHARESALRFYQNLGYRAIGDTFTEVSVPHRKMVKSLA